MSIPTPLFRTKTRGQQVMEQRLGVPIERALYQEYVLARRSVRDIGLRWGIDYSTVSRWIRDFNISRLLPPAA
jgi:transposase-like protein